MVQEYIQPESETRLNALTPANGEVISALIDGELPETEVIRCLNTLTRDDQAGQAARQHWQDYHAVNALFQQSDTSSSPSLGDDFSRKFALALDSEPYHFPVAHEVTQTSSEAASRQTWWRVAAAAAFAGLVVLLPNWSANPLTQLAKEILPAAPERTAPAVVAVSPTSAAVEPSLAAYLQAHQQTLGWSRLHAAPVVVRYVEEPIDARRIH
ncbi:RseA family anti-sigma factor [Parvibium lacunae]|uniref:Anti sigma-E protein RseA N-terminal domain-containing protein n=1 Tax=Parvibium lacunae TaxID=1888893 RepID=A0A368L478_9BURK|nr:RseA family anti-sigma factor [Parvibium lacunae]RCS58232.1 hypothetical protein DU000_05240 [Parvibium lacunae]